MIGAAIVIDPRGNATGSVKASSQMRALRALSFGTLAVGVLLVVVFGLLSRSHAVKAGAARVTDDFYSAECRGVQYAAIGGSNASRVADARARFGRVMSWRIVSVACKPISGEWVAQVSVRRSRATTQERVASYYGAQAVFFEVVQPRSNYTQSHPNRP
jgi:hypothetical protein